MPYDSGRREAINRNTVVTLALAQGFNVYLPVVDEGIDFILHKETGIGIDDDIRLVQLKGRMTIRREYERRNIWIAFPERHGSEIWYLVPHDQIVVNETQATKTSSWQEQGAYSWPHLSQERRANYASYRFGDIGEAAGDAADGYDE